MPSPTPRNRFLGANVLPTPTNNYLPELGTDIHFYPLLKTFSSVNVKDAHDSNKD
jgi:hypothetical protein